MRPRWQKRPPRFRPRVNDPSRKSCRQADQRNFHRVFQNKARRFKKFRSARCSIRTMFDPHNVRSAQCSIFDLPWLSGSSNDGNSGISHLHFYHFWKWSSTWTGFLKIWTVRTDSWKSECVTVIWNQQISPKRFWTNLMKLESSCKLLVLLHVQSVKRF